ncbi:MAG: alpha/beta hydrolase family protein [Alphaproteobacteria bacterium]
MTDFVLVHGAWHGGWCWRRVADRLRTAGHDAWTPTLTGLGERSHLFGPDVNINTHVQDILNVIKWERLDDIVLVGHSYGGPVITGVADAMPERIRSLVYLDAHVPKHNQSLLDMATGERGQMLRGLIEKHGDHLPPTTAEVFGVTDPADARWVDSLCTNQPAGCMTVPIHLTGAWGDVKRRIYVLAGGYVGSYFHDYADRFREDPSWEVEVLPTGHDMMVTMPDEVTDLLLKAL